MFVSILRDSPPCPPPRVLCGKRVASPERGSTGSKIVLENEKREREQEQIWTGTSKMRSIRQFESRAGIVIEKIRTYATVDGKIYWCSLNFWVQPQNLQNYGSDVTTNNTRGMLDNNFDEFTRQTKPEHQTNKLTITNYCLVLSKTPCFPSKMHCQFCCRFFKPKRIEKRKDRFPMAFFYNAWIHFRRMNCISRNVRWFSAEQKWGTRKLKGIYMSKLIFHFLLILSEGFSQVERRKV